MGELLSAELQRRLVEQPAHWLVTGVAGFIGSNLLEALLRAGQRVTGIDDFSTGFARNLDEVRDGARRRPVADFRFVQGDIRDAPRCVADACSGVDYVLHQAALGSVPRSIEQPLRSFDANVDGFMRVIDAARDAGVKRFVYASSSSVYGDSEKLPKVESEVGAPAFAVRRDEGRERTVRRGLRAHLRDAVRGPALLQRVRPEAGSRGRVRGGDPAVDRGACCGASPSYVNGDGVTSRDFCYVANAVQANVLAAVSDCVEGAGSAVFNVAVGEQTSLLDAAAAIRRAIAARLPSAAESRIVFREFRAGDVRHSLADISLASKLLGYRPTHRFEEGLAAALDWYLARYRAS